jgi:hypothetical protein
MRQYHEGFARHLHRLQCEKFLPLRDHPRICYTPILLDHRQFSTSTDMYKQLIYLRNPLERHICLVRIRISSPAPRRSDENSLHSRTQGSKRRAEHVYSSVELKVTDVLLFTSAGKRRNPRIISKIVGDSKTKI